jgi:1L-myo-inositol 1-phosphate cytidylyltransferase / CDP-L-myo-inositol myo-inositolphosphotransferase
VTAAVLYLTDAGSAALAAVPVAGRPLALRAIVAAARAGAEIVAVPAQLRTPALERLLARTRGLGGRIRWLGAGEADTARAIAGGGCLLVPVAALVEARTLVPLLADSAETTETTLTESLEGGAPVLRVMADTARRLAPALAAGEPLGPALMRHVEATRLKQVTATGLCFCARTHGDLATVDRLLYAGLGTDNDTGVDDYLHRRLSRKLTRILVRTPATPNQVSLLSLSIGLGAVWAFWNATPLSAAVGVVVYLVACVVDHSDGELARLTFQESRLGAHLDWAIDTVIHSGLVLGMAVSAGPGAVITAVGLVGSAGVVLSALFARYLPREIAVGETVGGALKNMGNRDLFYLLLLGFVLLRWLAPSALPALALLVALGSQSYWIACVHRIRRGRTVAS